jgi:hypothetical protein
MNDWKPIESLPEAKYLPYPLWQIFLSDGHRVISYMYDGNQGRVFLSGPWTHWVRIEPPNAT